MTNNFDLEDELEYPEGLYLVVELSDSILELTEKLEQIRGKLDNFEQRYLEADEELRECKGYEIPSSTKLERWHSAIEEKARSRRSFRRSALTFVTLIILSDQNFSVAMQK